MEILKSIGLVIMLFISTIFTVFGEEQQTMTYDMAFSLADYSVRIQDDLLLVESKSELDFLPEGPFVPMRQVSIAVPSNYECEAFLDLGSGQVLSEGVELAASITPSPTSEKEESNGKFSKYDNFSEMTQIVSLGRSLYQEVSIFHFAVTPFKFNEDNLSLSFFPNLKIRVILHETDNDLDYTSGYSSGISDVAASMWSDIVINPEVIESTLNQISPLSLDENYELVIGKQSPLDYVIITNNYLAPYFADLLEWKKTKGLRCDLITVESISENYSGNTIQEKIKTCLHTLYQEKQISYVLLGGDDSVVPSQKCKVSCYGTSENSMPSDLYYGCFSSQFNWDKNANNIIGEIDDDCGFVPDILITRLPVSTPEQVTNSTYKIRYYERHAPIGNKMLMSGVSLSTYFDSEWCDSYYYAENIYSNDVQPYWAGNVDYFFDKENDRIMSAQALVSKFNEGYDFVSMGSHGVSNGWSTATDIFFDASDVNQISRRKYPITIVSTTACHTNAFDGTISNGEASNGEGFSGNQCLSQAFISSKSSGVIAYFGSSRAGWYYINTKTLGSSSQYEKAFYKTLFSHPDRNKNYGRISALAKMSMVGSSSNENSQRWLQFSINPIGDPEMPIFTQEPKTFSNVQISKTYNGRNYDYTIDTGEDGCNICLYGTLNGSQAQVIFRGARKIRTLIMPVNSTVCITKQNFRPYVSQVSNQGTTLDMPYSDVSLESPVQCEYDNNTKIFKVSSNEDGGIGYLNMNVTDILGNAKINQSLFLAEDAEIDLSSLNKGIYVVTIAINGNQMISYRIFVN